MFIENPSMMFFIMSGLVDINPLCVLDVQAWYLVKVLAGQIRVPSRQDMQMQNLMDAIHLMQNAEMRYRMDRAYYEAYRKALEDACTDEREEIDEIDDECEEEYDKAKHEMILRFIAREAKESSYPVDFGSFDELNDHAKAILDYNELSYQHRQGRNRKKPWRTFRDYSNGCKFKSLFTGKAAAPLKKRWLDIDAADESSFLEMQERL